MVVESGGIFEVVVKSGKKSPAGYPAGLKHDLNYSLKEISCT